MIRIGFFGKNEDIQEELNYLLNSNDINNFIISGYYSINEVLSQNGKIKKFENFNEFLENCDVVEFLSINNDVNKYITKSIKNSKDIILNPDIIKNKDLKKILMLVEEANTRFYIKKNEHFIKNFKESINNSENINCLNIKFFNNNIYNKNELFLMIYDIMCALIELDYIKLCKIHSYKFSTFKPNDSIYVNIMTNKGNIINILAINNYFENALIMEIYELGKIHNINLTKDLNSNFYPVNDIFKRLKTPNYFDPEKEVYPLILTHQVYNS